MTSLFRTLVLFCCLLLAGIPAAEAQIENSGFPVLQLAPSSRSAAMGGSDTALEETGSAALFTNPALLSERAHGGLSFSYLNHLSDINAGWVTYGKHIEGRGSFAAGLRYLSFGQFDERDESGEKTGTFSASDVALTVGGARAWKHGIRYGASLSLMHASLASNGATGTGVDAGIYYDDAAHRQSFGVSLHNLGVVFNSVGERSDRLPLDLRVGYARRLAHLPLTVSVTGYRLHRFDGGPDDASALARILYHVRFGGEFRFSESFQVRFGYDHRQHDELRVKSRLDMAGFSTGLGLKVSRFGFDYGYNSWSSLGGLHRFSVTTTL